MLGPLEGPYQSQEHVWGFFVPGPPQRPGTGQRLSTRIAKTLTVGASLQRLGGVSKLVEPKSKHSRRTLRLSPAPLNALQSERQRQREAKIAAGMRWRAPIADLVFTDSLGAPLVGTRPGGIARHPLAPPEAPPRGAPAGLRGRPGNREPSARPQLSRPDRLHLRRGVAQLERGCRRSAGAVLESARLRAKRRPGSGAPPTGPQLSPARAGCRARRPRSR